MRMIRGGQNIKLAARENNQVLGDFKVDIRIRGIYHARVKLALIAASMPSQAHLLMLFAEELNLQTHLNLL
jgi:hypothetical protein